MGIILLCFVAFLHCYKSLENVTEYKYTAFRVQNGRFTLPLGCIPETTQTLAAVRVKGTFVDSYVSISVRRICKIRNERHTGRCLWLRLKPCQCSPKGSHNNE